MRAFIGFDFPIQLKSQLTSIQELLKKNTEKGSWVSSDNFHLTLKFLGEIDETQVDSIAAILNQLSLKHSPITVNLHSLGYFNKKNNEYGVMWLGLDGQIERINSIYIELEQEMDHIGFKKETRKFNPHITLGRRIKTHLDFSKLKGIVEPYLNIEFTLDNLVLMKSQAIMGSRVYTPIKSYKLNSDVKNSRR